MLANKVDQSVSRASLALEGIQEIRLEDLSRYKSAIGAGEKHGWGYYFPYLCARNPRRRLR